VAAPRGGGLLFFLEALKISPAFVVVVVVADVDVVANTAVAAVAAAVAATAALGIGIRTFSGAREDGKAAETPPGVTRFPGGNGRGGGGG